MNLASGNRKTGPIPVSTTSSSSCPDACPFKSSGVCYAKNGPLRLHWQAVDAGRGGTLKSFVNAVKRLPKGQLWRHNQAGDLPGKGDALDVKALGEIVRANTGRRGFTYTHKPLRRKAEREAVRKANASGFTVSLSANDLEHADRLADLGIAPVVTVLPSTVHGPAKVKTPEGRTVVVCPASYRDDVTCATCGACAVAGRKSIIGFPAHGSKKLAYDRELLQARLPGTV